MNLLLDTHIYIWWLNDDKQLTNDARKLIIDANTVYVSSISIWETIIKVKLGKLEVKIEELINAIDTEGFEHLPFTTSHASCISSLPNHHRDPFDRALVAQAISEPAYFVSADKTLQQYSEFVIVI